MIAVELNNISKNYKGEVLLDDINLCLKHGEIYALIGKENKQLINRLLMGLVKPTNGSLMFWGKEVKYGAYKHLDKIGAATSDIYFYEDLSAFDNISLYMESYKKRLNQLDTVSVPKRIEKYFRKFNMVNSMHIQVKNYSLGMLQKLRLIRAFVIEPSLVVLEEPFKSLDPLAIQLVKEHILSLVKTQVVSVFITTSMLGLLDNLVDRVGVLHQGKLIEEINIHEFQFNQQSYLKIQSNEIPKLLMVLERKLNIFDFEVINNETVHILENFTDSNVILTTLVEQEVSISAFFYGFESLETYFLDKIGE